MEPTTGYLVWRLSTRWRTAVDRAVKPLGLTHATFSLLGVLTGLSRGGKRPSQRQLADHTGLDAIYVSKLARTLEKSGLLERPADPDDPRAVRLGLTDRGREVITAAFAVIREVNEEVTSPIGGTKGPRNALFRETLLDLLRDNEGENMTTTERTISGRDIVFAASAAGSVRDAVLAGEGLTFDEYVVLRTAAQTADELSDEELVARAAAGPAVGTAEQLRLAADALATRGLLAGGVATDDGREVHTRLVEKTTAAGDRLFDGFSAEELAITQRVLAGFTERASEVRAAL